MTAPITLLSLDTATLAGLRRHYEDTPNVESRTGSQMILLAQQDYKVPQIARIVLRSEDTVARVLKRFLAGGLNAVPRRSPPSRERRVTAAWETELLAEYLGQHTGIQVTEETVRVYLHASEWVRLHTPDLDLTTQSGRASGLRGKRLG